MNVKAGCLIAYILLGIAGLAQAKTIAYWRFEEGSKGLTHAADQDGWYKDISGNENHLSSWVSQARPKATDDVPFAKVPQTNKKNKLALDFDGAAGSGDHLGTFIAVGASAPMINSFKFKKGWTVECSFKIHSEGRWQIFIGKDGRPGLSEEPVFSLKIMDDNRLQLLFCDDDGRAHTLESISPLVADEWHDVAATYDGSEVELYLKRESDREYLWQSSDGFLTRVSLGTWASRWTIGRGMWNGAPTDWFHGVIDEVRISDTELDDDEFLGVSN